MMMSKIKNALDGINCRLDTAEEMITELEGIAMETIQIGTYIEKWTKKIKRAPMSCETISGSLIYEKT